MLNEERTKEKYGYISTDWKESSNKPIVINCDYCGIEYDSNPNRRQRNHKDLAKDACMACRFIKREEVSMLKYGLKNATQQESSRKKMSDLNSERFKSEEYKDHVKAVNLEKRGVDNSAKCPEVKERAKQTNLKKYGKEYVSQVEEFKEKIKETNIIKYGYDHRLKNPEIKEAFMQQWIAKKRQNGTIPTFDGKSTSEWAKITGYSSANYCRVIKKYGFEKATTLKPNQSTLEMSMEHILKEIGVDYKQQLSVENRRADFYIPSGNLIIECDSFYYHNEMVLENNYHVDKRNLYLKHGYTSLFFREDEIDNKPEIIKSIVLNKLGKSKRIFARKCILQITDDDNGFLVANHLMGKGKGKCLWLYHDGQPVSCMRIKCISKKDNRYEISRFCNVLNTNVIGGFSRLAKYAQSIFPNMSELITFIDFRYGSGEYLTSLGFEKAGIASPSFKWTDGNQVFGRMTFPGNSGYDIGLTKIWDCGQQKYILNIADKNI